MHMTKKRLALLLSLLSALCLLTVTAWADAPAAPDQAAVYELVGDITLQCQEQTDHNRTFNKIFPRNFTATEVTEENGTYTCTLTILGESFLSDVNLWYEGHTLSGAAAVSLTLTYDTDKWVVADTGFQKGSLVFTTSCKKPAAPTMAELAQMPLRVRVSCDCCSDYRTYDVAPDALDLSGGWIFWSDGTWGYCIPFDPTAGLMQYNKDTGVAHLLRSNGPIALLYQNGAWTYVKETAWSDGFIFAAAAPTMDELKSMGLKIGVSCTGSRHAAKSDFALPSADQLTYTLVWNETGRYYETRISLTTAAADSYVAQYGKVVGATHTRKTTGYVTIYWYNGGPVVSSLENGVAVQAEIEPPAQSKGWKLDGQIISITAQCDKPIIVPTEDKKITSAKTFDAGIAAYMGLSILSAAGTAVVFRKKREQ